MIPKLEKVRERELEAASQVAAEKLAAQLPMDPELRPRVCGPFIITPKSDDEIEPAILQFLRGTKGDNRRQSFVYLIVGLALSGISIWGFVPGIIMRVSTGDWWRDPVNMRTMPLPGSMDWAVSVHGLVGVMWLMFCAVQLVSGAMTTQDPKGGWLRAMHRRNGAMSVPFAGAFYASCTGTWLAGAVAEPLGEGYNSLFVRAVQSFAVMVSALLFCIGLHGALARNIALHKDAMMGCILFAIVPTGVPRFGRDLLQWSVGNECNVSTSPEFWFFWCCGYCIVGWPLLFCIARRYWTHNIFSFLLKINIVLLIALVLLFRPAVRLDPCWFKYFTSGEASEAFALTAATAGG